MILDWIDLSELPALVVLVCLLVFVGGQMARPDSIVYRQARRLAGGTIVAYAGLGIYTWEPTTALEVVVILIRALLAAGIVFGVSTIVLAVMNNVLGDPLTAIVHWYRDWSTQRAMRVAQDKARREAAAQQRRQRDEQARLAPLREQERQQLHEQAVLSEEERLASIKDARETVTRFYDEHAQLLVETLPPALLRSRLETHLPESLSQHEAWQAVQEMINEMLPLIAESRQQARAEQDRVRERDREIQRLRREIRRREEEIQAISQTPGFDAEVSEPEIRVLRDQIRELEDDLESLPD